MGSIPTPGTKSVEGKAVRVGFLRLGSGQANPTPGHQLFEDFDS